MPNQAQHHLVGVVATWYVRKWKVVRALAFVCLALVSLVLFIIVGATLEGGSGVVVPLAIAAALGVPSFLFARYAHRRVTRIDSHELVSALREHPAGVEILGRSWTLVPDLGVAGLLAGRKERLPCLELRVRQSGKRYIVPMTEDQCDHFSAWLGATPHSSIATSAA